MSRPFTRERLDFLLTWRDVGLLRHDVDCSPLSALVLAVHEAGLGVKATYYLRADEYYDYDYEWGGAIEQELRGLGHTVGDHVEWEWFTLRLVRDHLSTLYRRGTPVSVHNPPTAAMWQEMRVIDYAYAPKWQNRYYSDSRGSFRFGDPEDHEGPWPIQLSLHPDRWMGALLGDDHPLAVEALRLAKIVEKEGA